jgi:CelD/BcsL family acetyltransferase involved in cellulose biosynthesis
MTLTASFSPLSPLPELGRRWQALEERATGSFFLGWTWMESWLSATAAKPELLAIRDGDVDVALAMIGRSKAKRLLGRTSTLWLNQAGDADIDRPFIEYNGLLSTAPGVADAVAMQALLARRDWRALRLSGLASGAALPSEGVFRRRVRTDVSPAYHVDLAAVRDVGGDYLSRLSANTRSQIRRAAKDYQSGPEILVGGPAEGEQWLDEMQALNGGRHADNAWDSPRFRKFAATLLHNGFSRGEVELLRIMSGEQTIGLLLNFIYRGRAMNYQSAFSAPLSTKGKPGLLCHAVAVERYAAMGLSRYSLLAGRDRYKQSLSTGAESLEWWTLERFSPRLEAEALVRKLLKRPASA